MITYVSYLRQSTIKQQVSRLGVDAQREIIKSYLGDTSLILREYVETESGKKNNRPRLSEALELCKRTNSVLICAKLDRLSRNVAFTSRLLESDVEIVFCDFPKANRLLLHIVSSIAEYEASLISERTRLSLEVKKGQGAVLGKPENLLNNHSKAIANSVLTNRRKAMENENNRRASALILSMRKDGATFFRWRISSIGKVSGQAGDTDLLRQGYGAYTADMQEKAGETSERKRPWGLHFPGSSSPSLSMEHSCIRSNTSVSHITGLTPHIRHVPSSEYMTAVRSADWWFEQNK